MARQMAVFSSENEARDAYFREDGDSLNNEETFGDGWGEPVMVDDTLEGPFWLERQDRLESSRSRYFLSGGPGVFEEPPVMVALRSGGGEYEISDSDTFDDLPSHDTENDAREAHAIWLEQFDGEIPEEDENGHTWSEWEIIDEASPWFVYGSFRSDGGAEEYFIAGEHPDGFTVFLAPGADLSEEAHIYSSIGAVEDALAAYFDALEDGDIPEDDAPTGGQPDLGSEPGLIPEPGEETEPRQGLAGPIGGVIDTATSNPMLTLAVIVLVVLILRRYNINPLRGVLNE